MDAALHSPAKHVVHVVPPALASVSVSDPGTHAEHASVDVALNVPGSHALHVVAPGRQALDTAYAGAVGHGAERSPEHRQDRPRQGFAIAGVAYPNR